VADVSAALLKLGANVEDVATSVLRGHFALMLVVAAPDNVDRSGMEVALQGLRGEGLSFDVWDVHGPLANAQATHVLTVYGPDSSGIVHAVSRALADLEVSICDMVCRLHEGDAPLYVISVEAAVPDHVQLETLEDRVRGAIQPKGLELSVRSVERSDL
jgi:glycine cleavage system transcriptional repressor